MSTDRAQEYWDANPAAAFGNPWMSNPTIADMIYRRMTGGRSWYWLDWLFHDYFKGRRFERVLSPGCGIGDHELGLARLGAANEIDAFDFSSESVRQATAKAVEQGHKINFYQDDLNTFTAPKGHYDLVFCSGSVHHCKELERFFATIAESLKPDGYFVINEYIGPCYNLYPPEQCQILDRLLWALAPVLRAPRAERFINGTLQQALQADPSESVRSELIMPFLAQFFTIELRHDYGGTILHPLYPLLNDHLFKDPTKERMASILRLIGEFEAILIENGVLKSDFTLCVCRPK
jgi:2-polyprenyl-3-methyl-5-hydroxy-6-metoxy-1,4-benzoquinol methylase